MLTSKESAGWPKATAITGRYLRDADAARPPEAPTGGTADPVPTLDEMDKRGASFRGNLSAVLLEVLGPERSEAFLDRGLACPSLW